MKSMIHGMMLYCILVYTWPSTLLKKVDTWIRNFIWSGDVNKKMVVTVAWHGVCTPKLERGLGLRSLKHVNKAAALTLCWELIQSDLQWATLLRARVLRNDCPITYHIGSSIWAGLKSMLPFVKENLIWQLGDDEKINFRNDHWLSKPLVNILNIPDHVQGQLNAKVKDFIKNERWFLPSYLLHQYPQISTEI